MPNDFGVYTIVSGDGKTKVSLVPKKGGVVASIVVPFAGCERELLFRHEYFWDKDMQDLPGALPFLFPVCARLERMGFIGNYLYDGNLYNLPIHGLGWWLPWEVIDLDKSSITMVLCDSAATIKIYPFNFRIELKYIVNNNELVCLQKYANTGKKPMPYAAGFHPYFSTKMEVFSKDKIMLDYKAKRHFIYNKRMTDLIGVQALLPSPISIADPRIDEQLVEMGCDKTAILTYPDGLKIHLQASGVEDPDMFKYIQIYTPEDAPFVCVEPWTSVPNALNSVSGMRWLQPGQTENAVLNLAVHNTKNSSF